MDEVPAQPGCCPRGYYEPLLKNFRNKSMKAGLAAAFLYNKAIKVPLLQVMTFYFGIEFVIVLMTCMVAASIVQGKVIDMVERHRQI